jgi:hypothetical protein
MAAKRRRRRKNKTARVDCAKDGAFVKEDGSED